MRERDRQTDKTKCKFRHILPSTQQRTNGTNRCKTTDMRITVSRCHLCRERFEAFILANVEYGKSEPPVSSVAPPPPPPPTPVCCRYGKVNVSVMVKVIRVKVRQARTDVTVKVIRVQIRKGERQRDGEGGTDVCRYGKANMTVKVILTCAGTVKVTLTCAGTAR